MASEARTLIAVRLTLGRTGSRSTWVRAIEQAIAEGRADLAEALTVGLYRMCRKFHKLQAEINCRACGLTVRGKCRLGVDCLGDCDCTHQALWQQPSCDPDRDELEALKAREHARWDALDSDRNKFI